MFSFAQNYITRGFWGDEAWTSMISQLPYTQMLKTTAADFHPPAYYSVVELVYKFFPPTEMVTRSISFLFYLLTIFMVYKLAQEVKGHLFGILSAAVVALNPIFFTYAFEARNYTMFAFAATGSIYFLIKLSEKFSLKTMIPFILFTTLGIYTHYYMFFILAAQGLYLLISDRKILIKMIGAYAIVGALYLPWIPFLFGQLTSVSDSYWISPTVFWNPLQSLSPYGTHYEAFVRILGGEHPNAYQHWLYRLSATLLLVGIIQHLRKKSFEKPYILIWLWAIVPFVLATIPGLKITEELKFPFRPIFFWRYLIGSSVPLSMLVIHASQKLPGVLFKISVFSVITLSLAIDYLILVRYPNTFKQAYEKDVIGKIESGQPIVTVLPSFAEVIYYRNRFGLENEIIVLPEGLVQFSGKSLLDSYEKAGIVKIEEAPSGKYFELLPGPQVTKK